MTILQKRNNHITIQCEKNRNGKFDHTGGTIRSPQNKMVYS